MLGFQVSIKQEDLEHVQWTMDPFLNESYWIIKHVFEKIIVNSNKYCCLHEVAKVIKLCFDHIINSYHVAIAYHIHHSVLLIKLADEMKKLHSQKLGEIESDLSKSWNVN